MRISDWSSDVCSSDLIARYHRAPGLRVHPQRGRVRNRVVLGGHHAKLHHPAVHGVVQPVGVGQHGEAATAPVVAPRVLDDEAFARVADDRSEEHTSELQSLMRNSYAVLCLKKKTEHTLT